MKIDTRNLVATVLAVVVTLTGATYIHRSLTTLILAHEAELGTARKELEDARAEVQGLTAQIVAQDARQAELEQQLVVALEAAGQKAQADALAKEAQATEQARIAADKQAALAKVQADAQATADAAAKAKALADAQAKAAADAQAKAKAQALADAQAKATADAKAAADAAAQNAAKPSRRTTAS